MAEAESAVRRTLLAAGFHEAISSTFCSAADAALTAPIPGQIIPLGNPLSEEAGVIRPSLIPGMLTAVAGNLNRNVSDVRLFELGTVFSGTTEKVDERPALAFAAVGALPDLSALHPARAIEFHDLKGVIEQILSRFQTRDIYFDRFPAESGITPAWLHPYRAARVAAEGLTVGWFGQLHPHEAAARKIEDAVLIGELYLDRLYKLALRKPAAREISRFQPVRRDFSLVLDQSIPWSASTAPLHRCRFRSLSSGALPKSSAIPVWARTIIRYLSAPRSRPPIEPCARKNSNHSNRVWLKPLAKRVPACGHRIYRLFSP